MKINWEQFVKTLSGEFIKNSQLITEGRIRHIFADGIQMCVDRLEAEKSYFDAAMRLNSSKPLCGEAKRMRRTPICIVEKIKRITYLNLSTE